MRWIYIIILCFFNSLVGQNFGTHEYDYLYKRFEKIKEDNHKLKTKSVKVYESSTFSKKLIKTEEYNQDGNLLRTKDHHFHRRKDFEENQYFYDSLRRIRKIVNYVSFSKGISTTEFIYDQRGNVSMILKGYMDKDISNTDTLNYFYDGENRIAYRIDHMGRWNRRGNKYHIEREVQDTIFYLTNSKGNTLITSVKNAQITDNLIRDSVGCIIAFMDTSEEKITFVTDQFCNELVHKEEIKVDNKWITTRHNEYKYDNQKLIERKLYQIKGRNIFNVLRKRLILTDFTKFEYNSLGQMLQEIEYNKSEKVKCRRNFVYEYYP